ncbi:NAD(P)-dependent oxidoreductase [Streptomyces sp. NPDC085995]|uniref:NAD(P)-dependent oxidoreductase n=1 Tax=Streptomyces sp. NPDC085995 TaxID=3154861 RepID=UPI003416F4C4
METRDRARLDAYFARISWEFAPSLVPSSLLVTQLRPGSPAFVRAVGTVSRLRGVLPGPGPVDGAAQREVGRLFAVDELSRERLADPGTALTYLETRAAGEPVVLLDAGGCFAPSLDALCERFSGSVLGVVEAGESGHRRYADREKLPCPVVSVARSPLCEPEGFLIGQSVVSSAEVLLRGRGETPQGRRALVLGLGAAGSAIARLLHAKGMHVTVYETDPERRAEASARGFDVVRDREAALRSAGLVVCATGALSLRGEDFAALPGGAFVATVTGPAEEPANEPEPPRLPDGYSRYTATRHVTRYEADGHYFYAHNAAAAVEVPRGADADPHLSLVQAEIMAGMHALADGGLPAALHEPPTTARSKIAALWLHYFTERV